MNLHRVSVTGKTICGLSFWNLTAEQMTFQDNLTDCPVCVQGLPKREQMERLLQHTLSTTIEQIAKLGVAKPVIRRERLATRFNTSYNVKVR